MPAARPRILRRGPRRFRTPPDQIPEVAGESTEKSWKSAIVSMGRSVIASSSFITARTAVRSTAADDGRHKGSGTSPHPIGLGTTESVSGAVADPETSGDAGLQATAPR